MTMSEEPTWKDEAISWYASDLHEMGYIKNEDEWNELLNLLCDTVQAHLEEVTNNE
jgi:hypothetical protein